MFLNPIWSVLLLIVPVVVWFYVIKPRLGARLTQIYAGLPSLHARIWARIYAFRTFWLATFAALITAAPDILVHLAPLDFSPFLPEPWPMYTSLFFTVTVTLMKAFETKPGEEK